MVDPCSYLEKVLNAARGALVFAVERAQRLPKIIDESVLSEKDAAIYAGVNEPRIGLSSREALKECREAIE